MAQNSLVGRAEGVHPPGLARARSWLFVPGDRPDRFDKAAQSAADMVICDLEDSVRPASKVRARDEVVAWLSGGGRACVRTNAVGTPWFEADLAALKESKGLHGLMIPKAEAGDGFRAAAGALPPSVSVVAFVETAAAVHRAAEIASIKQVARLAFGSLDFVADIDAVHTHESLLFARAQLVVASRAAGKPSPVDGVTAALADRSQVASDAAHAPGLGFGGSQA